MVLGTMVDLSVLSYLLLIIRKEQGAVIGRGRASPQPSGEAESSPQGSGEAEPIFHRSGKKCSSVLVLPEASTFDGY